MRVYAATGDYITVFPDDDYDPTLNLRAASRVVARATRAARYDVDSAGKPSDPTILAAFTEATVLHAHALYSAGITDPTGGAGTLPGVVASSSIGSASLTYTRSADSETARAALLDTLCADAAWALESAGLASGPVSTW